MDDRYNRYGPRDYYRGGGPQDQMRDPMGGRDYGYSSARDYAAAEPDRSGGRERGGFGGRGGFERGGRDRGWEPGYRSARGYRDEDRYDRDRGDDRGFFERAGDEVLSWFGDEEAERRREMDQRHDARMGANERWRDSSARDDHYHSWRRSRIAELDRDYDEYRRENARRFESEFNNWRNERQGQRDCLKRVSEHMEVLGSDGSHVGTVDKVRGDRIILTKSDPEAGGHHHSIPSRWIDSVDDKVKLRKTADEAQALWKDEERGAFFGESRGQDQQDWRGEHNLNRSFSGTY